MGKVGWEGVGDVQGRLGWLWGWMPSNVLSGVTNQKHSTCSPEFYLQSSVPFSSSSNESSVPVSPTMEGFFMVPQFTRWYAEPADYLAQMSPPCTLGSPSVSLACCLLSCWISVLDL